MSKLNFHKTNTENLIAGQHKVSVVENTSVIWKTIDNYGKRDQTKYKSWAENCFVIDYNNQSGFVTIVIPPQVISTDLGPSMLTSGKVSKRAWHNVTIQPDDKSSDFHEFDSYQDYVISDVATRVGTILANGFNV